MRLINTTTRELCDFIQSNIPPYAILSHTWDRDEVSLSDLTLPSPRLPSMKGYGKIIETCRLAKLYGLGYAWIDTCCIDKSSSADLTESINSMFKYYQESAVCIVHLADYTSGVDDLAKCRWFTRGWTLQELLAPQTLDFYDGNWGFIGSKFNLLQHVTRATNVPSDMLVGRGKFSNYSVATRMSWASKRQTTRVEDIAYCLLGIFEVNMPLVYGEGLRAFQRLQKKIIKQTNDLTILAWDCSEKTLCNAVEGVGMNLLALTPADFHHSGGVEPFPTDFTKISITTRGLKVSSDVLLRVLRHRDQQSREVIAMWLGTNRCKHPIDYAGGIVLRKLGPGLFCRHERFSLVGSNTPIEDDPWLQNSQSFYIVLDPSLRSLMRYVSFGTISVRFSIKDDLILTDAVPERLWDPRTNPSYMTTC